MPCCQLPCQVIHQPPPPPTCPPSPASGPPLSTCLSANQPTRPQNEDTEEGGGQTDSGAPPRLQLRPAAAVRPHFPECTLSVATLGSAAFVDVKGHVTDIWFHVRI